MSPQVLGLFKPLLRFAKSSTNASALLFIAAILAMILANSPYNEWYQNALAHPVVVRISSFNVFSHNGHYMSMLEFVNDALMAVFFFVVGLEIKREVLVGELSSFRKAILPIIAACGGMVVPVLVYYLVCNQTPGSRGMAIPMATDIAFALGVLSLLGKRVPISLRIFLTALAVVDDIGGILIIALFYSGAIAYKFLVIAFILLGVLYWGNKQRVSSKIFYYLIGFFVWILFLESGIHPTIAGVLVAFTVPARPKINLESFVTGMKDALDKLRSAPEQQNDKATVLTHAQIHTLKEIEWRADRAISPLQDMVDDLEPFVNYLVLPLFA
ncbi:MAG: Na+/H+ antiporter NhaA, partial [Tannerellaceae bacterium]